MSRLTVTALTECCQNTIGVVKRLLSDF